MKEYSRVVVIGEKEIKIDVGKPVTPKSHNGRADVVRQLAQRMDHLDSVLFPKYHSANFLSKNLRDLGFKAVTRKVAGGFRCWKIDPDQLKGEDALNLGKAASEGK